MTSRRPLRATAHRVAIGVMAGMAGPTLFVIAFTAEGLLHPGYQPWGQYVSELALGPRGWVRNLNFMVSGLLIVVFAWGLAALRSMGRGGPILVALIGLALFLSGFFVMDPFVLPRTNWTVHGTMHQLLGALAFTLMPTVAIVLAWRWRRKAEWRAFRRWTVAIVMVMLFALVLLRVGPAMPPAAPTVLNPWRGLIQRGIVHQHDPGIGAEIMGAGKYGYPGWHEDPDWQGWWGANPPFHTPVFVLTHHPRPSIEIEGGTAFHFLDASPAEALSASRQAADGKDVRIGGGATVVRDFLAAGLVDYAHIVVVPILLGRGVRLWDGLEGLENDYRIESTPSPSGVTHLNLTARVVADRSD